ncbi:MAG: hypothetical protein JW712_05610 [Dehalococcoidales bacterium]|nr:hypothetical protein [Dehalococcoidales bacterium]
MKMGQGSSKCPKCNGNVFFERSVSYNYEKQQNERAGWCLQCGFTVYLPVDIISSQEEKAHAVSK